ncbi:MAG: DMT family transporter, partial [Candidatus Peregrinibacteria bacterium]|nr:DMT family transporter [Candidatus Peregrinibacteria bacterium]
VKHPIFWLLMGVLMSVHWILSTIAFEYTLLANAMLLGNTNPLYLLFLEPLVFHTRLTVRDVLFSLITLLGVLLLVFGKGFSFEHIASGDIYSLSAAFFFAIYAITARKRRNEFSFYVMMFWLFALSAFFMIIEGQILDFSMTDGPIPTQSWFYLLAIGFWCTALGHSAYNISLRALRTDTASVVALVGPVFAAIWGYLFFEETLSLQGFIGMCLTLVGIYSIVRSQVPKKYSIKDWFNRLGKGLGQLPPV